MKLLILTQKVDKNDDVLGFFHSWLLEFAKQVETLTVICLYEGSHDLPGNVKVLSLGKENGVSRIKYIYRFFKYINENKNEYDNVFVHMNPIYVVLGGLFWRLNKKKIALWYTHKHVNTLLRIAERLSHIIFSASKFSFRLKTRKLHIVGHGIDVARFECKDKKKNDAIKIISVGRITRIKNYKTLLKAAALVKEVVQKPLEILFIGGTTYKDDSLYLKELKKTIEGLGLNGNITFVGSVPNHKIHEYYCDASLSVNMTPTGGVDKVVLESIASKTPVLASNEAFVDVFGEYAKDLVFKFEDHNDLADKIVALIARSDIETLLDTLEEKIRNEYSVELLIKKILEKI